MARCQAPWLRAGRGPAGLTGRQRPLTFLNPDLHSLHVPDLKQSRQFGMAHCMASARWQGVTKTMNGGAAGLSQARLKTRRRHGSIARWWQSQAHVQARQPGEMQGPWQQGMPAGWRTTNRRLPSCLLAPPGTEVQARRLLHVHALRSGAAHGRILAVHAMRALCAGAVVCCAARAEGNSALQGTGTGPKGRKVPHGYCRLGGWGGGLKPGQRWTPALGSCSFLQPSHACTLHRHRSCPRPWSPLWPILSISNTLLCSVGAPPRRLAAGL